MVVSLSRTGLNALSGRASVPGYERATLQPGVVHFGVGNFHRAHQAVYLDSLFRLGKDHDWAVIGVGTRREDEVMRERLEKQDWLSTVVEQSATETRARVTASMVDFLPSGDSEAIIAALADPRIRIVSLTITEGGYYIDATNGTFDAAHGDIRHDAENPDRPTSVFGLMLAGLRRRCIAGIAPFTVMSCDNIPHNGSVTREALVGLARLSDNSLAEWIGANVAFPNSMVDRITPATTERERAALADQFGIADMAPVFCETFTQWVLEDDFPAGRPALETVGVQFVPDVSPYELMKIRILNGGHAAIAYPAGLLDIHFVHEAMEAPLVSAFLNRLEIEEILPTVPPVPGTSLTDYLELIETRFANPKIGDTVRRLCLDGSNRQPKFILPTVRARLAAGGSVDGLALVSALWCRYCAGTTESGAAIAPNDPNWARLTGVAQEALHDPIKWLGMTDIFGDLAQNDTYRTAFSAALRSLCSVGVEATIRAYLDVGQ